MMISRNSLPTSYIWKIIALAIFEIQSFVMKWAANFVMMEFPPFFLYIEDNWKIIEAEVINQSSLWL